MRTIISVALALIGAAAPKCFAGTVRIVNDASREIRVAVYYFEKSSKTGNLLTRADIGAGDSWAYSEPYRPTEGRMVRTFRFENISGSEYAKASVLWTQGAYADTVSVEELSDSDPNDKYLFADNEDESAEGLEVIRCSEQ